MRRSGPSRRTHPTELHPESNSPCASVTGFGQTVGGDALYSPNDEAAAAVTLQSFAKRCSVDLGQADDTESIDSPAINAGLVQADCRSVVRGRILRVESREIPLGFGICS